MNVPSRVGLISDTHGTVSPRVLAAFSRVERILHAGDVGNARVLAELELIAPVTAVRGNMDAGGALARLPAFAVVDIEGVRFVVTHVRDRAYRVDDARRSGCDVYVYGHTHVPAAESIDGLWLINPGSASSGRTGSPHCVAVVELAEGAVASVVKVVVA